MARAGTRDSLRTPPVNAGRAPKGPAAAPFERASKLPERSGGPMPLIPVRDRAEPARRAGLRHLLAPAARPDHLPGERGHRRAGQRDHRPAPVPRGRGPGQGDLPLHQLAGGSVTAGLAIYDTMQFVRPDVSTLCLGQACSMGAWLLAAGRQRASASALLQLAHHDPPAHGRRPGAGHGHRHPGERNPEACASG